MRSIFILLLVLGHIIPSNAQEIPKPVKAELVSDISEVKPGDSFNLGVLFKIDPGWHIYWRNPGDSGLPTTVEFMVPTDYKTGALNWPAPQVFQNNQGGTDYGYADTVLLWSSIEVPENANVNSQAVVEAQLSWLSCKEICIPGKANLKYDIKIGNLTNSANEYLFSKWLNRIDQ